MTCYNLGKPNLTALLLSALAGVGRPLTSFPVAPQPREPYNPETQDRLEQACVAKAQALRARRAAKRIARRK